MEAETVLEEDGYNVVPDDEPVIIILITFSPLYTFLLENLLKIFAY